jgi:hypothetical protein
MAHGGDRFTPENRVADYWRGIKEGLLGIEEANLIRFAVLLISGSKMVHVVARSRYLATYLWLTFPMAGVSLLTGNE